jgi:hypothetical protein
MRSKMLAGGQTLNRTFVCFQIELDIDPDDKVRVMSEDFKLGVFADLS